MKFSIDQVLKGEANFCFNTFGAFVVKNLFGKDEIEKLKLLFDRSVSAYVNQSTLKVKLAGYCGATYMIPSFLDNNQKIRDVFYGKPILGIADAILGRSQYRYWGSDASQFTYGTLWHRDTATLGRQMKMNLYLGDGGVRSGAFAFIPGSQHVKDQYGSAIGKACAWPNAAPQGGVSESKMMPIGVNPNSPLGTFYIGSKDVIPSVRVPFKKGDLLVFDNRTIHAVPRPFPPKTRRLITTMFSEFPSEQSLYGESVRADVRDLKQHECDTYRVPAISEEMVTFLNSIGYSDICKDLDKIRPSSSSQSKWSGNHQQQSDALKALLTRNYG